MAKRLGKKKLMTVVLVRVRGLGWTFQKAIGSPLHTRFTSQRGGVPRADGVHLRVGQKS
jgi:hypothetical protein